METRTTLLEWNGCSAEQQQGASVMAWVNKVEGKSHRARRRGLIPVNTVRADCFWSCSVKSLQTLRHVMKRRYALQFDVLLIERKGATRVYQAYNKA